MNQLMERLRVFVQMKKSIWRSWKVPSRVSRTKIGLGLACLSTSVRVHWCLCCMLKNKRKLPTKTTSSHRSKFILAIKTTSTSVKLLTFISWLLFNFVTKKVPSWPSNTLPNLYRRRKPSTSWACKWKWCTLFLEMGYTTILGESIPFRNTHPCN